MLKVEGPPPVPQVSIRSPRLAATGAASPRIVRARPTPSGTVSPFARRAIRKAPVWIGSARPSMISLRTAEAWSAVRRLPAQTAAVARLTTSLGIGVTLSDEVGQQVLALRGEDRLGVELNPLDRQLSMARAHHHVAELGGQLQLLRQLGVGDQRVVAAGDHRARQADIDGLAVVLDFALLAVDRLPLDHAPAEGLDHRLVAEADAEDRRPGFAEGLDRRAGDTGLGRRAGAGRDDQPVRLARQQLCDRRLVVAHDFHLRPQLAQVLDEVVGEGVVVVDHQHAHPNHAQSGCSQATSTARNTALALLTDSFHSYSGFASATVPPPACTCSCPSLTTTVRMWIAVSRSPSQER